MRPMKAVQRRRLIDRQRTKAEGAIVSAISPILERRFKWLKRDLRKQNLRKRLQKTSGMLAKQGDEDWDAWISAFGDSLASAISAGVDGIAGVESEFFTSRGLGEPTGFSSDAVVDEYQERIGRKITNIGEDTLSKTQDIIAEWYKTDKTLPELIESLSESGLYGVDRAKLIAETEMGFVASQVSLDMMDEYGIDQWFWDAILDAATCPFCGEQHGKLFNVGDAMPPDASHPGCRCGTLYARNGVAI